MVELLVNLTVTLPGLAVSLVGVEHEHVVDGARLRVRGLVAADGRFGGFGWECFRLSTCRSLRRVAS